MFRSSIFEKSLENATSNLLLDPDWPSIILICDAIRQNDVAPKQAILAIKKKMFSTNPHTAMYALIVLESVVKNCGTPIHEEIASKANCEMFTNLINTTQHENVRAKMLELIQCWAYAFRTTTKYRSIKDTMNILKTEGHTFPELKEADAMFTSDTAPDWVDGEVCHRCRVAFSFTQRKHHCRNCGQVFCAQCACKYCTLPKYGIEKEVRVCEACYVQLQKPTSAKTPRPATATDTDLPAEYLASSLAQQTQTPPKRSEQELQEEEELQLALALSQSEAEQQQKAKSNTSTIMRTFTKSPSPEAPLVKQSSSPVEETPSDPELAKYLNRSYWEQRQISTDSPASPSAPSPMPLLNNSIPIKLSVEDSKIDEFAHMLKTQVEIFVNRMKSNSSRGRSISNDSSVQTLFMNFTSLHSQLLMYIKDMDDKRMWYEQLQDKLAQIKDSRAALDVLRQEHQEKLRRHAEEMERQRQLQMAHKLEIMRKKKQEYLQYQRQLALQRIQEQEREMQLRQEQQKAQYIMGTQSFPYMSPSQQHSSPIHQMANAPYQGYGYSQQPAPGNIPQFGPGNPGQMGPIYSQQPGIVHNAPQTIPNAPPQQGQPIPNQPGIPAQQRMMPPQQQQQQSGPPPQQFMGPSMMMMNPNQGIPPGVIPSSDMSKSGNPMIPPTSFMPGGMQHPMHSGQSQLPPPGGIGMPPQQPQQSPAGAQIVPSQTQIQQQSGGMQSSQQPPPIMQQQPQLPGTIPSSIQQQQQQHVAPNPEAAARVPPNASLSPPAPPGASSSAPSTGPPNSNIPAGNEVNTAELISFD